MIPEKSNTCAHINFDKNFTDKRTEQRLLDLQTNLLDPEISDIVINLENCQWFEIFPLSRLVIVVCASRGNDASQKKNLHIVGPCRDRLRFFSGYVADLEEKLKLATSDAEILSLRSKIDSHTNVMLQKRTRAGAFLVGWGFFESISQHSPHECRWYRRRETEVSLQQIFEHYNFGYVTSGKPNSRNNNKTNSKNRGKTNSKNRGKTNTRNRSKTNNQDLDRVWPFTLAAREDFEDVLDRVNGEELVAGALSTYARDEAFENGTVSNILVFEPFDNIFEHAFTNPNVSDLALLTMQITNKIGLAESTNSDESFGNLPAWEQQFLSSAKCRMLEIVIADCGNGIPATLDTAMQQDELYLERRRKEIGDFDSRLSVSEKRAWEVLRYAFEPHSTKRAVGSADQAALPGRRGLSWLRDSITQLGGAVQVISNGVSYVLATVTTADESFYTVEVPTLMEFDFDSTGNSVKRDKKSNSAPFLQGTFMRILFPLREPRDNTIDRHPSWKPKLNAAPQDLPLPFLPEVPPESVELLIFPLDDKLLKERSSWLNAISKTTEDWEAFFGRIKREIEAKNQSTVEVSAGYSQAGTEASGTRYLVVIDLLHYRVPRVALEFLFAAYLKFPSLAGRIMVINCDRHVACSLAGLQAIEALKQQRLVVPLFDNFMRVYWVGASPELESTLITMFSTGQAQPVETSEFADVIYNNPILFMGASK